MRIDLHAHSNISDGTESPAELVRHAAAAGLDVVAITDHDTVVGWQEATAEAAQAGIVVVPGVEVSTVLAAPDGRAVGVHVLAYLPDAGYVPFAAELERIRDDRADRLRRIVERLNGLGVRITTADALAAASDAVTLGRPHVADALVANGYVVDREEAFGRWLAENGPAYVPKYAPATTGAIGLIRAAGGVAVLAHPWGRGSREVLGGDTIRHLAAAGLAGLEVDHSDHDARSRERLRGLARELDLVVTGSSDHHGTGKTGHALGTDTTAPDQYERLLERARTAARDAGRVAPRPAGPDPMDRTG